MAKASLLKTWLAQPHAALANAVANDARAHVQAMKSQGIDFYGYALLPGEIHNLHRIVAATNIAADLEALRKDKVYRDCSDRYLKYCVDEWQHFEHDAYQSANTLLAAAHETFRSMHSKPDGVLRMDDDEIAHANRLLAAILRGLEIAKARGDFGAAEPFLALWVSDSSQGISLESVRRLNSQAVANEFLSEFG